MGVLAGPRWQGAEGTEHFVYASSSSVYGANSKMPFSEHDPTEHQVSLYAATKKSNENQVTFNCNKTYFTNYELLNKVIRIYIM